MRRHGRKAGGMVAGLVGGVGDGEGLPLGAGEGVAALLDGPPPLLLPPGTIVVSEAKQVDSFTPTLRGNYKNLTLQRVPESNERYCSPIGLGSPR